VALDDDPAAGAPVPLLISVASSIRRFAALAAAVGFFALPAAALAQSLPGLSLSSPAPSSPSTLYVTAPIVLDGVTLFQVAEPASGDDAQPVAARANDVAVALDQILAVQTIDGKTRTAFDPQTLHVEIVRENDQTVLEAVDKQHRDGTPIVTVTTADATYNRVDASVLAEQWQATLQTWLVRALEIRQPAQQRKNLGLVVRVAGVLALITLLGSLVVRGLSRRISAAAADVKQHDREVAAERAQQPGPADDAQAAAVHRARLIGVLARRFDPAQRLAIMRAIRIMTVAVLVLAWFGVVSWATLQFPATAAFGAGLVRNAFRVTIIWVVALLIDRSLTIVVERLPTLWELRALGGTDDRERQVLRAPTIARALGGFKTVVLVFIAALATMTQVGIPVGSVVTIGGLAAIAVSLAAQNLIRDVVSGFLVLIEDQFVVGDTVTINAMRGTVERLTLRMVQLRDESGSLVTLSNSAATSVINHSRNWSRVDYAIPVDASADLDAAMTIVRDQLAALRTDPAWHDAIVDDLEWIGIESISRDGAILKARIKTAPLRQYALRRELNARVARAFAAAKIGYGAPIA
jgi:small conductance mechanosensitive channel